MRQVVRSAAFIACLGVAPALGAEAELERHEYTKVAMGVEARVVLYAPSELAAAEAATAAFERIDELDRILSHWRDDSELSALLRSNGDPVDVSPDLARVLWLARDASELTRGAFDVTVGPLVELWKRAGGEGRLPTEGELSAARELVGMNRRVRQDGARVELVPGTRLDLGGIGKGYACDRALEALRGEGFAAALVELGGDLALGDAPPGREGWEVLVGGNSDRPPARLVLARCGVASSGDREQAVEVAGTRYSHVVDPRSGLGTTHGLGFSVVAGDAARADALASAACVLGADATRRLLPDGARLFVDDPRFVPLFDGKSLDGWTTTGGRYDGNARWSVEDGCLVGRAGEDGEGGLIYAAPPWTHFALELDVRIAPPFDSGVFVRMRPPGEGDLKGAQITLDDVPGGEIGAVYADGFLLHNEAARRHWNAGGWNRVEVRCTGFDLRLVAILNGHVVADYALPPDSPGYASDGLIGLQVHPGADPRGEVRFRNVAIRPLPAFGEELPDAFEDLLAGGLDAWEPVGSTEGYTVEDGVLCVPAEGSGCLRTKEDFTDLRLRLDFAMARMANSGVYLRSARTDENPSYSGCEVQILDDFNWEEVTKSKLVPYQFTGGLYGSLAPSASALRPIGEWNTYEILYRGSRLAVALNSRTLYDVDTLALKEGTPFAERVPTGFVGFQRYGAPDTEGDCAVRFRNVRVQRLDAPDDAR